MSQAANLIRPESTALVVIDLQEKLAPAIAGIGGVLENTRKLLRLASILKLKTFVTTQYEKGLGATLPEIAALVEAAPHDKVCFGCLGDAGIREEFGQSLAPGQTVLLAGIESHICVMQTALGAIEAGYNVHVAADATGSRSAANASIGIERMREAGAVISSTEMAIYELLGDSRRPEFKQMLTYLK
jgi:nicotinamidase-related amidase